MADPHPASQRVFLVREVAASEPIGVLLGESAPVPCSPKVSAPSRVLNAGLTTELETARRSLAASERAQESLQKAVLELTACVKDRDEQIRDLNRPRHSHSSKELISQFLDLADLIDEQSKPQTKNVAAAMHACAKKIRETLDQAAPAS